MLKVLKSPARLALSRQHQELPIGPPGSRCAQRCPLMSLLRWGCRRLCSDWLPLAVACVHSSSLSGTVKHHLHVRHTDTAARGCPQHM